MMCDSDPLRRPRVVRQSFASNCRSFHIEIVMSSRLCGRLELRFASAVLILVLLAGRLPAATEYVRVPTAAAGWDGHVVLGSWSLLLSDFDVAEAGKYRLDVTAPDPDGNLVTFTGEEIPCDPGRRRLTGRFQLGKSDGVVTARILKNQEVWQEVTPSRVGDATSPLIPHTQAERLLITVGLPEKVQQMFDPPGLGRRTVIHLPEGAALPLDDLAYDGVAGLILAGRQLPTEGQSLALYRWVQRGGKLYVSVGLEPKEFRASALAKLLPVTVEPEPQSVRDLTSLESYASKTVRIIPPGSKKDLPKFTYAFGRPLAGNRNESMLIQVPLGFGTVTLLGLDVTQAPLRDWEGLRDLLRRMTAMGESAASSTGRSQQLGSTGITELSSQLSAALEHFASVSRTSPWWILVGLVVVMALIGPLDYYLVARVWRKPLTTWISFPLLLILSAGAAIWAAGTSNGHRWLVNELDVVDVDAASGFTRGRHFITVYSPQSTAAKLELEPVWPKWSKSATNDLEPTLGWWGLSEASFGGMYRTGSGGLQFGQAHYSIEPQAGVIRDIPLAQWSTVALTASSESSQPDLVDSKLFSSATGRLSGTVMHRLPGPLTNWFLTYAGRIYRLPAQENAADVLPLAPQQVFRVDQQSVIQRELRGYLTRTTAREIQRTTEKTSKEIILQQASYDPLSQNLTTLLPILSFHREIGGGGYTGLTNDTLAEHDLTPLLELDRAVLFGYLDQPAAEVTLGEEIEPTIQRTTLVRLLLPVDRSKQQAFRDLPKFDKP